jgi:hypothetical protein
MKKTTFLLAVLMALPLSGRADQFNLGVQFESWNSNFAYPVNGWEVWTPISMAFKLDSDLSVYAKGKFGAANYTCSDTIGNTYSNDLTNFTDTVLGGSLRFECFSLPAVFNISLNLPSGNPAWEGLQNESIIPTEFINSRYQGRGFGANVMYGLSFDTGKGGELGVAAGYQYTGGYNVNAGISSAAADLNLGDTIFLALNLVQAYGKIEKGIFRLSGSYFLSTQDGGVDTFRMGPALSASYTWRNPKGFSVEVSGQYFFPAMRLNGLGELVTESVNSYGPRIFLGPSYVIGDLTLAGRVKYVFANGYAPGDALYDGVGGGGLLAGVEPSFWMGFDKESGLRFSASYDYVSRTDAGYDISANLVDATYNRFTFGSTYEVKW